MLKGGPNWRVDLDRRQARKVELLTIDWHVRDRIDRTDHCCNDHAALTRDFLKTVPELVFDTDTRFVARNDD